MRRHLVVALAASVAAVPCGVARGETPQPAGIADLMGARGLSLGAYRGIAAGNDGIFTNAASLAAHRRYSMEATWFLDRYGADTALQVFGVSVVDSQTSSFTGGLAYLRAVSGPWTGNLFYVPLVVPIAERLFVGVTGKYLSLDGGAGDAIRAGNVDASMYWQGSSGLGLGVSGYNLIGAGHIQEQPRAIGAGASYGDDRRYHVAVDWRGDTQRAGKLTSLWAFGGELLLGDNFPVRASYVDDTTRNASFWSAGAGVVSSSGVAVDLAYRQGISYSADRTFAVSLKLFLSSR